MARLRASDALFGKARRAVLALLFGSPGQAFYTREIVARAGVGSSQVQRELEQLAGAGLLVREPRGRRVFFRANRDAALFPELVGLARKLEQDRAASRPSAARPERRHRAVPVVSIPLATEPASGSSVPGLSSKQHAAIARIARAHGLRRISLFGSAARGPLTDAADIDLLIEFAPGRRPSLWDLPALQEELVRVFGRPVDLATPEILENPYRRASVLRDLTLLYAA